MRWRFYLINRNGVKTRVEDPLGWDGFSFKIKRHPERHGTFREIGATEFKFTGTAMNMLKAERKQYGIRGQYALLVQGKCNGAWTEMYKGQLSFETYKFVCGSYCYVSIQVDQIGPLVSFINLFDQKVDLSKSLAFDGTTALTDYPGLSKIVTLPSKAILLRAISSNQSAQEYQISSDSGWFPVSSTGNMQGSINVPFATSEVNSIKDFTASAIMDYYNKSNDNEYVPELIYNNPNQALACIGTLFYIEFRVKGTYKNLVTGSGNQTLTLALKRGTQDFYTGATQVQGWTLYTASDLLAGTHTFDVTWSGNVTLAPGEKLWLDFFLTYFKSTNFAADVRLQIDPETYFKATVISKCDPSTARLYMVNEATSRVIESITNGAFKLYSTLYGRTDSQPYAMASDGCAGFRAVTTGLDIRKAKLSDGTDPKMFLSMKDIFDSLCAIDNIGIGPEGEDKIRIENWKWFYQNTIVFTCRGIETLEHSAKESDIWSIFKTGYDKWESEDYNGLDEFLTKREFRTSITQVQNTLEKLCKFIASGYAWEVTRRKQGDTKDWRYDNDTFIVCLTPLYEVEVNNITSPANILDPATVYNFRISPMRNAMRWFDKVAQCYTGITNSDKLSFSAGDGNYKAQGELDLSTCRQEGGVLSESADLSLASFATAADATPITAPDRVSYSFPLSFSEYNQIKAQPYGLIEYITDCERGTGWIDTIDYNPDKGLAKFTLIPKI